MICCSPVCAEKVDKATIASGVECTIHVPNTIVSKIHELTSIPNLLMAQISQGTGYTEFKFKNNSPAFPSVHNRIFTIESSCNPNKLVLIIDKKVIGKEIFVPTVITLK